MPTSEEENLNLCSGNINLAKICKICKFFKFNLSYNSSKFKRN